MQRHCGFYNDERPQYQPRGSSSAAEDHPQSGRPLAEDHRRSAERNPYTADRRPRTPDRRPPHIRQRDGPLPRPDRYQAHGEDDDDKDDEEDGKVDDDHSGDDSDDRRGPAPQKRGRRSSEAWQPDPVPAVTQLVQVPPKILVCSACQVVLPTNRVRCDICAGTPNVYMAEGSTCPRCSFGRKFMINMKVEVRPEGAAVTLL